MVVGLCPTVGAGATHSMSLLLLASWSNCPLETIELLCAKGLKEPALVGAFFDTPFELSKWLQRPATHQECDFLPRCKSYAQSRVDDSIVHAASSSAQSISLTETVKLDRRVCEEQGESLMQRIAAKARSTKKETVVDAAVQEENLPWLAQGQICW